MKSFILGLLCLCMFAVTADAATLQTNLAAQFALNRAQPGAMQKYQLGTNVILHQVRVLKGRFDFAVGGGAVGVRNLVGDDGKAVILPSKAIVVGCIIDVLTPGATAASGTIAIGTGQAANDLKVATGAASYTGLVACTPVGTAATSIKLTADRTMTATIATGVITAGKFNVLVQYTMSD